MCLSKLFLITEGEGEGRCSDEWIYLSLSFSAQVWFQSELSLKLRFILSILGHYV